MDTRNCKDCEPGIGAFGVLRRFHCRVMQEHGRSISLDEIYPDVTPVEAGTF